MSFFKQVSGALNPQIHSFTKILQRKRGLQFGPNGSAQGLFYRAGIDIAGNAMSPEATLARILKEWTRVKMESPDTQISLLEWRVFSKNLGPGYPNFSSFNEWVAWRLQYEFPRHSFSDQEGWTFEFLDWSKDKAIDFFT